MTLGESFDYISFEINQDSLGTPFTPEDFNRLLKVATNNYYDANYAKLLEVVAAQGISLTTKMFNNSPLFRFLSVKSYDFGNTIPPLAPLPSDLRHTIGGTLEYNNVWRPADFLDIESYNRRRYNILAPSTKRHPIFVQWPDGYQFVPHSSRKARVDYLRFALDPVYDFCIGVDDDNVYFMPEGSYIKIETGVIWSLYDLNDGLLISNVTHLSFPGVPYNSITVEWDWQTEDIVKISDSIIALSAVKSRELNVAQIAAQSANE